MSAATDQKKVHTDAAVLQHVQCLDSRGVPNFPDQSTGPSGGSAFVLNDLGIDPNSAIFEAIQKACQGIVPGSK
jgi:hypothetical protein